MGGRIRNIGVALFIAVFLSNNIAAAFDFRTSCSKVLVAAKNETKIALGIQERDSKAKMAMRTALAPFRIVFYPAASGIKLVREGHRFAHEKQPIRQIWKVPVQVLREDYLILLGFLWLIQTKDDEIVQSYSFDSASADFDVASDDDLLVVVETLAPGELSYGWAESFLDTKYAHFKHKIYIHAATYQDMTDQLAQIAQKYGPISRLDIVGFGNEGEFSVGQHGSVTDYSIDQGPRMSAFFKKDARIRLSTCLSGRGKEGEVLMQSLGHAMLEKGGTIYASTVSYYPIDEFVYKLGLGNRSRSVAHFFTLGPAAAYERLSEDFDFSRFGLEHRGGHSSPPPGEGKVKIRHFP